jgi:hypothetical protein
MSPISSKGRASPEPFVFTIKVVSASYMGVIARLAK